MGKTQIHKIETPSPIRTLPCLFQLNKGVRALSSIHNSSYSWPCVSIGSKAGFSWSTLPLSVAWRNYQRNKILVEHTRSYCPVILSFNRTNVCVHPFSVEKSVKIAESQGMTVNDIPVKNPFCAVMVLCISLLPHCDKVAVGNAGSADVLHRGQSSE